MTACGSGLLQRLVRKGGERQAALMHRYEKAKAAKDELLKKITAAHAESSQRVSRARPRVVVAAASCVPTLAFS